MQHNMAFADFKLTKMKFSLNEKFKENDFDALNLFPEIAINRHLNEVSKDLTVVLGLRLRPNRKLPYSFKKVYDIY